MYKVTPNPPNDPNLKLDQAARRAIDHALNPNAEIEIQMSDSTTGIKMVLEGNCDIGMASRELKDSETSEGATPTVIAIDGIAIIVNLNNPITGLTAEQVRQIYVGETLNWADVK